jgi:hypothetical protein
MADNQQLAAALSGTIKATPRNPVLGGVADLLGMAYKLPEMPRMGVPGMDFLAANRNKVLDLLGIGDVQKTADALSYGNAIGTGKGMTYRPKDETINAALAVAPMVAPTARMAGQNAMATGRAGERLAERVVPQIMERGGLPAEMLGAMGNRTISPLDVYHGTPHTLPPTPRNPLGEFDASKIGTGEGAQAYGYGIYTAENPAVAGGYAKNVKDMTSIRKMNEELSRLSKVMESDSRGGYRKFKSNVGEDAAKRYDELMTDRNKVSTSVGNLYKVDLPDEKIAQMLDFDKPLSQQKNILNALTPENMGLTLRPSVDGGYMAYLADGKPIGLQVKGVTPEVFRERWINRLKEMGDLEGGAGRAVGYLGGTVPGDLPPLVAKALRQAGIPGIKYFDEMSRSAGKGTRNFVVFPGEEKSMTILERNAKKP